MIWKLIEGKYEVSNTGLIRNSETLQIIRPRIDKYGYLIITLWTNNIAATRKVHRLVALAFLANPNQLATVNHKDGEKTNNHNTNLEWMSAGDNMRHGFQTGLHSVGEGRKAGRKVKLCDADIPVIRAMIKEGMGNTAIGKEFGVSCGCIYSIKMQKSWTHI